MAVEGFPKILHHVGPDVDGAADDPVSDGLDSLGNSSENPQLLAAKTELGTLEICHLEAEIIDKIEINERSGGNWQTLT